MMKAFKRYSEAKKYAQGTPVIRIGLGKNSLCIAGDLDKITEVSLISPDGSITGCVILQHLDRLGNANWATENPQMSKGPKTWPKVVNVGESYYVRDLHKGLATVLEVKGAAAVVEMVQQPNKPRHTVPITALY